MAAVRVAVVAVARNVASGTAHFRAVPVRRATASAAGPATGTTGTAMATATGTIAASVGRCGGGCPRPGSAACGAVHRNGGARLEDDLASNDGQVGPRHAPAHGSIAHQMKRVKGVQTGPLHGRGNLLAGVSRLWRATKRGREGEAIASNAHVRWRSRQGAGRKPVDGLPGNLHGFEGEVDLARCEACTRHGIEGDGATATRTE